MNSANIFNIHQKKPLNLLMSFLPKVRKLEIAKYSKRLQRDLRINEVLYEIYSLKNTNQKKVYDLNSFKDSKVKIEILKSLFEISFLPFFNGIGFSLNGHSKKVNQILTLPPIDSLQNGIVSYSMDNYINVWNINTKSLYASFYPLVHEDIIIKVIFYYKSITEKKDTSIHYYLFVLTWDKLLVKIDLTIKRVIYIHQFQQNHKLIDGINYQNKYLITSGYDKDIYIWSILSTEKFGKKGILKGHTSSVSKLVELSNGKLASGSWDHTIKIWNMETFECEYTISEMNSKTENMIELKDGRICAVGSDGYVKLFSKDYKLEYSFPGQTFVVQLRDGRIATLVSEQIFKFVDINLKKDVLIYKTKHKDSITYLQQLSDGRIATCSDDCNIIIHGFTMSKQLAQDSESFLYEYYDGCVYIIYKD